MSFKAADEQDKPNIERSSSVRLYGRDSISLEKAAAGVVDIDAKATGYVILACIIAASGGLLFGYDGGITGGVESMHQFAASFFPDTVNAPSKDFYCKYNDEKLSAYSSVMHFTGSVASFAAGYCTQHFGRTKSMIVAGTAYCIGAVLQGAAKDTIALIFIGRIFWGIGVGFGDHSAFIYTAEMAPPKWRGRLNTLVQLGTIGGIVVGTGINVGASFLTWGWRLPLALAAVPGSILLLGGLFLPETPNSLIERGHNDRARAVLQKVRGTKDVELEYGTIIVAHEALRGMENPWIAIFRRRNRPQLAIAILSPFFQQWSGVNAVSFFAPQIFGGISTFAASAQGPLYAALMVNGVQLITTIVTVFIVDKVGRRTMLFTGSCVGLAADIAVAVVFAEALSPGQATLSFGASIAAICLIGTYSASFGWSWGPVGWLVPSEVHDLNTRSAGQSLTVFTQLVSGATVTQCFLSMMCTMKYGVFIFFGFWQFMAILFVVFLLPETRGVPIEEAANFVRAHWFWRRVAYPGGVIPETNINSDNPEVQQAADHINVRRNSVRRASVQPHGTGSMNGGHNGLV